MHDNINGVLITGLLALLGTIFGGVVQGYWHNNLAQSKFQSELILKALEAPDPKEREASLLFLVETKLVDNPIISRGIKKHLEKVSLGQRKIPTFTSKPQEHTLKPTTKDG